MEYSKFSVCYQRAAQNWKKRKIEAWKWTFLDSATADKIVFLLCFLRSLLMGVCVEFYRLSFQKKPDPNNENWKRYSENTEGAIYPAPLDIID
jgi:hypothetical protein